MVMVFTLNIANRFLILVNCRKVLFNEALYCVKSYKFGDE